MKASLLLPTVSIALVLATPAIAQTAAPSQQDTQTNQNTQNWQSQHHESNVLTLHKLKQDLEQAGFTDVKVLANSFVIQAKDKEGNPTIMSLSPSGVFAISEIGKQKEGNASNPVAGASSDSTKTHGRTARAGGSRSEIGQASGPAEGTNVAPTQGSGSAGEPGRPGLPGDKNGPAEMPSNQHEH